MCEHPQGFIQPKEKEFCSDCLAYNTTGMGWICDCPVCSPNCDFALYNKEVKPKKIKKKFPTLPQWLNMQRGLILERFERNGSENENPNDL